MKKPYILRICPDVLFDSNVWRKISDYRWHSADVMFPWILTTRFKLWRLPCGVFSV